MCWASLHTQADGMEPGPEMMGSRETVTAGSSPSHLVDGQNHIIAGM